MNAKWHDDPEYLRQQIDSLRESRDHWQEQWRLALLNQPAVSAVLNTAASYLVAKGMQDAADALHKLKADMESLA